MKTSRKLTQIFQPRQQRTIVDEAPSITSLDVNETVRQIRHGIDAQLKKQHRDQLWGKLMNEFFRAKNVAYIFLFLGCVTTFIGTFMATSNKANTPFIFLVSGGTFYLIFSVIMMDIARRVAEHDATACSFREPPSCRDGLCQCASRHYE